MRHYENGSYKIHYYYYHYYYYHYYYYYYYYYYNRMESRPSPYKILPPPPISQYSR